MAARDEIDDTFVVHDESFRILLGSEPRLQCLLENQAYPFAHEAGVFIQERNELFITSYHFEDADGQRKIHISKVTLKEDGVSCEEIDCPQIKMANGGVNYKEDSAVLFCAQGNFDTPSGLYVMSVSPPYDTELLVSSFYGRQFNSLNDVVVHTDGSIWFTDPIYGYEQGYRPKPELPNQIYRYDPSSRGIRVIADGFGRPNGLCFSPDEKTMYITDTDWVHGDGTTDATRPSTM